MSASMAAIGCKAEVADIAESVGYDPSATSGFSDEPSLPPDVNTTATPVGIIINR